VRLPKPFYRLPLRFDVDRLRAEVGALPRPVMPPAEVDLLIVDLRSELALEIDSPDQRPRLSRYHALLLGFGRDWRQLYTLHGEDPEGWPEFARLREDVREQSRLLAPGLMARANRVPAHRVLEARILRACLSRELS
jgi:hypothetical protein